MSVKSEMSYWIACDGCGARPEADYYEILFRSPEEAIEDALGGDWYKVGDDKHACSGCVSWDGSGDAVLTPSDAGDS